MRYIVEFRVRPMEVTGNGIPFAPRLMWTVEDWSHAEGQNPPAPLMRLAYWSRSVALAIAKERTAAAAAALPRLFSEITASS